MEYRFKIKPHQLDRVEAEWRRTLGTGIVNRAVEITRTETTLRIVNEKGDICFFEAHYDQSQITL